MSDSMVERVALVLTRAKVGFGDATVPVDAARGVARTVIAAMRDPTEAMQVAGHAVRIGPDGMSSLCGTDEIYTAMIDAALTTP